MAALRLQSDGDTSADPLRRRRTVRLGPSTNPEQENTSELESPGDAALAPADARTGSDGPSVSRDLILSPVALPTPAATHQAPAPTATLDRLIAALGDEIFPSEPSLYFAESAADPFDGMLGSTLELRIEPNLFGAPGDKNHGRAVTDEDLGWLSPRETLRPRLPNSYGLSDEHVSRLCLQMYKELGAPRDEALLAVGALARLEANIADSFVGVGCAYADLIDASGQQDGSSLRELLEPTDILGDPDLLQALKLWQEERHDVRFWSDDEGTRLKAPRLVGAYLLRKRGEVLSQLTRPLSFECSVLSELLELIDQIRDSLNERQRLIRDYFPAHAKTFATSFLVKRGINAAPGFFWLEAMREEL